MVNLYWRLIMKWCWLWLVFLFLSYLQFYVTCSLSDFERKLIWGKHEFKSYLSEIDGYLRYSVLGMSFSPDGKKYAVAFSECLQVVFFFLSHASNFDFMYHPFFDTNFLFRFSLPLLKFQMYWSVHSLSQNFYWIFLIKSLVLVGKWLTLNGVQIQIISL